MNFLNFPGTGTLSQEGYDFLKFLIFFISKYF
ncbi:MAG: hypothetical protein FD188_3541, partial [Ignavibacteria bacterium]